MQVFGPSGEVRWVPNNSGHRSWSATVMLSEPSEYEGGEFIFYRAEDWKAVATLKERAGTMIAFRGDHHHTHGVRAVRSGERSVLLLFLREERCTPEETRLYHRDGTGHALFWDPGDMDPGSPSSQELLQDTAF